MIEWPEMAKLAVPGKKKWLEGRSINDGHAAILQIC